MPTVTSPCPQAEFPEGERRIIHRHQKIFGRVQIKMTDQSAHGLTGNVHESFRPGQNNGMIFPLKRNQGGVERLFFDGFKRMFPGNIFDKTPAGIVPGAGISSARITESDN